MSEATKSTQTSIAEEWLQIDSAFSCLEQNLRQLLQEESERLLHIDSKQTEETFVHIRFLQKILEQIPPLGKSDISPQEILNHLQSLTNPILQAIDSKTLSQTAYPTTLYKMVRFLHQTELKIAQVQPLESKQEAKSTTPRVAISSAVLYQVHSMLFPPERIVLIAGRNLHTPLITLEVGFDVTSSQTHPAHGKADSDKLDRVFRIMDYSGTGVGAWAHSHPGKGKSATSPSPIDRAEHTSWLKGYAKSLIGVVMVEDGYFRVFGDAVESGQVRVEIIGKGVVQEDIYVYRLTRER